MSCASASWPALSEAEQLEQPVPVVAQMECEHGEARPTEMQQHEVMAALEQQQPQLDSQSAQFDSLANPIYTCENPQSHKERA